MEEKKKSKYLRDKDEPKKSKYIRSKDDPSKKSIYRNDGEGKKFKSGSERYAAYLEREKERNMTGEEPDGTAETVEAAAEPETETVNDEKAVKSVFKGRNDKKIRGNIQTGSSNDRANQTRVYARMIFCCIILEILAVILQVFKFRVPLTPIPLSMDLSAIPELLSAVAYGPLVGIAVTLFKNLFYVFLFHSKVVATAVSNTILDSIFVISASLIYTRGMFSPKALQKKREKENISKDLRSKQIIKSGLIGAVITTVLSFFSVNYIVLPMIFKQFGTAGHTYERYLLYYQNAINTIIGYLSAYIPVKQIVLKNLAQGTLIFNLPMTFSKLVIVTLIVALIYRFLSDFLHYRNFKK